MNKLNATIEISKNSTIKYEFDRKENKIVVDRILRGGFKYPANYGFIPHTLDWDGDELDVVIYSEEVFQSGVSLDVIILGAMLMIDDGETDTKLIAIHADDYRLEKFKNLTDLPSKWLEEIKYFFENYKNWKRPDIVKINGFEDSVWTLKELKECQGLYTKYKDLPKKEFITKMKILHPEKYSS